MTESAQPSSVDSGAAAQPAAVAHARADKPERRWLAPLVCVALGASIVFLPLKWPCPVHAIAGVPCPTCGMTRSVRLILHGDLAGATAMHPLVWVVVPWLSLVFVLETIGYFKTGAWGGAKRMFPTSGTITLLIAALVFALWIARFAGAFGGPVPNT